MCGIIGYTGHRTAAPILLDGLRRLEYRGYDSAGLVLAAGVDGGFWLRKCAGRVAELESRVQRPPTRNAGIAHTRWATHGGVTDDNAHPHWDGKRRVMVVHNGIIDNADDLKRRFLGDVSSFHSETDTEVLAHLISLFYEGEPVAAVSRALGHVRGTYGIAVLFVDYPELIVAARLGSPLVVGIGEGESILASDPQAIVAHTRRVIYLNDHDIVTISPSAVEVQRGGVLAKPAIETLEDAYAVAERGDFEHFMLKEIFEQPESVERCLAGRLSPDAGFSRLGGMNLGPKDLVALRSVVPIGCGTAYFAGIATAMAVESLARLPAHAELAADFRSRHAVVPTDSIYLAFSQSGETADTIGAVQEIIAKGGDVAGVVNVVGSTLARLCGRGVYLHAGPEAAVASTKAFTSQLSAGVLFALMLARARILSEAEGRALASQLAAVPQAMRRYLAEVGPVKAAAEKMVAAPFVLFIGRGFSYPVALEGALKFKELAYVPCEGFHAGEMKHGPIAMIQPGTPVVAIVPSDSQRERTIANVREAMARGASVIAIHTEGDDEVRGMADISISVPRVGEFVSPIVTAIPVQLLSYYGALAVGADVDKPRNLAKSVTVE